MFDYKLRITTPRILKHLAVLVPQSVSPNTITLLGFIIGLLCILSIITSNYLYALILFGFNRTLDALDGYIARARANDTKYGFVLDITADFFVYATIPLAMAYEIGTVLSAQIAGIMIATYYVNAGIWMSLSRVTEKESRGLIEGFETILFYAAMLIFPQYFIYIGIVFAILVALTAIIRISTLLKAK